MVLRIPEQGGHAPRGSDLPRGLLLLQIVAAEHADVGVAKVKLGVARRLSRAPVSQTPSEAVEPASSARPRGSAWGLLFLMLAIAWIAAVLLFSSRLPH